MVVFFQGSANSHMHTHTRTQEEEEEEEGEVVEQNTDSLCSARILAKR